MTGRGGGARGSGINRLSLIFKWKSELLEVSTLKSLKETGSSRISIWFLKAVAVKVRVGEHSDISVLTNKRYKSKKSTAFKDHMLIWGQPLSFDNFKVLTSSDSDVHLQIKESLVISRDQLIWIKMRYLCHYICLISYTNILQSCDCLVSSFIHCYLLFVVLSNKINAPVSFKILLKVCW